MRVDSHARLCRYAEEVREALTGAGVQSGSFDTSFVDDDVRVSRGDRGEMRVFVR